MTFVKSILMFMWIIVIVIIFFSYNQDTCNSESPYMKSEPSHPMDAMLLQKAMPFDEPSRKNCVFPEATFTEKSKDFLVNEPSHPLDAMLLQKAMPFDEPFSDTKSKIKIYNFNTSWCGYSVKFQPEWNKFSDTVKLNNNKVDLSNVEAADIKCDDPLNKQMCQDFQISGFPSVVAVVNDSYIPYNGGRTSADIIEFITKL